jgi:hypothetical protein
MRLSIQRAFLAGALIAFLPTAYLSAEEKKPPQKKESAYKRLQRSETLSVQETEEAKADEAKAKAKKPQALFPGATRAEPESAPEKTLLPLRNKAIAAFTEKKYAEALPLALELAASEKASLSDKAVAAQIEVVAVRNTANVTNAQMIAALKKAVDLNGSDNNTHYGFMYELAQRQFNEKNYEASYTGVNRFLTETKTTTYPDAYALRGNSQYRLNKLPAAETDLKAAIAATGAKADPMWTQLLIRVLSDQGKKQEAAKYSESIAQNTGSSKDDQINLAISYRDANQLDKAIEVVDALRKKQELKEERDYRVAMEIYRRAKMSEKAASVIGDGLKAGALKEDTKLLEVYGESLYDSEQYDEAVAAWNKAAPNAKDGGTYLNLAIVLLDLQRYAEAKDAAQKALNKGLKPGDQKTARQVLSDASAGS